MMPPPPKPAATLPAPSQATQITNAVQSAAGRHVPGLPAPKEPGQVWPEHWTRRTLKPGVKPPKVTAYKQTQGPFYIASLHYGKTRITTFERTTEQEAIDFSLQFYMNETRQGREDSE